jgi:Putative beta-barrel porin-2, OmpL-like. bbp2
LGVTVGTEAAPWNWGVTVPNPFPNPVFPGNTMLKDPGAQPSITAGIRWQSDSGHDNVYIVSDAINAGNWGYNNLQWTGVTWYHTINKEWHFAWETYTLGQRNVLNITDPGGIIANGGYPFANLKFNQPGFAICSNPQALTCDARSFASLMYLNWHFAPLDNLTFRFEYFDDMEGQRTGIKTRYLETGIGWQHWLSPQIELRPEITYYNSLDAAAFNGNPFNGIAPTRHYAIVGASDIIWHF